LEQESFFIELTLSDPTSNPSAAQDEGPPFSDQVESTFPPTSQDQRN